MIATRSPGTPPRDAPGVRPTVDALVGDVERPPVAVEQLPQRRRRVVAVRVRVARVLRQPGHAAQVYPGAGGGRWRRPPRRAILPRMDPKTIQGRDVAYQLHPFTNLGRPDAHGPLRI